MADNVAPLPGRGKTLLSGANRTLSATGAASKLEGLCKNFNDRCSAAATYNQVRSQKTVKMMLVRNVSGVALAAKSVVKWATGYRNRRVGGYCSVNFEEVAGVVDEFIGSAGVPNNDLFWLAVAGPALIRKSLAASAECVIAEGQVLVALTAASSQAATAGRILPYAATTDVTSIASMALNRIGRALSASTTSQTGGSVTPDVLVDLEIQAQAS